MLQEVIKVAMEQHPFFQQSHLLEVEVAVVDISQPLQLEMDKMEVLAVEEVLMTLLVLVDQVMSLLQLQLLKEMMVEMVYLDPQILEEAAVAAVQQQLDPMVDVVRVV